jgi:hypothetical protein
MKNEFKTLFIGLSLLIPASVGLLSAGVPTLFCPFPILTAIPALLLSSGPLFRVAVIIPTLLFFAWNPGLFRGAAKVPMRSYALLAVTTMLSVIWFVGDWKYGLQYHGAQYTYGICVANIAWLVLLGAMFGRNWKRESSFKSNLLLHWILFAWLGWYAFPYLGELP